MNPRIYKLSIAVWLLVAAFWVLAVTELTASPPPGDANHIEAE
jgi:hypothetical protein